MFWRAEIKILCRTAIKMQRGAEFRIHLSPACLEWMFEEMIKPFNLVLSKLHPSISPNIQQSVFQPGSGGGLQNRLQHNSPSRAGKELGRLIESSTPLLHLCSLRSVCCWGGNVPSKKHWRQRKIKNFSFPYKHFITTHVPSISLIVPCNQSRLEIPQIILIWSQFIPGPIHGIVSIENST